MLFEAATGQAPFHRLKRGFEQLQRPADPVRKFRRLPKALSAVIDSGFEQDPARRPTILELTATLSDLAGQLAAR